VPTARTVRAEAGFSDFCYWLKKTNIHLLIMAFMIRILALISFLVVFIGCASYKNISYTYDKNIDFGQYMTFAWAPDSGNVDTISIDPENLTYDNDIVRNNAKNYITHCLSKRGFLINTDSPDVIFQLILLNDKNEQIVTYRAPYSEYYFFHPYYFPYYYPYYRFYTWYGWQTPPDWLDHMVTHTKTYVKGTITINMFDRKLDKLVWSGSAEGDIYDPTFLQYDVHPAIDRIMSKFPIKTVPRQKYHEDLIIKNKMFQVNGNSGQVEKLVP
jgi:hypothetical protein